MSFLDRLNLRKFCLYSCAVVVSTLVVVVYISTSSKNETVEPSNHDDTAIKLDSNDSVERKLGVMYTPTPSNSSLSLEALSEPQSERVEISSDINELENPRVGPFNSLEPSKDQTRVLYNATEALIKQCMNQRGFTYETRDYSDLMRLDVSINPAVQGNLTEASVRGYGLAEYFTLEDRDNDPLESNDESESMLFPSELFDPNAAHTRKLSTTDQHAWGAALHGEVTEDSDFSNGSNIHVENQGSNSESLQNNSCIAVAERKLHGSNKKARENLIAKEALQTEVIAMTDSDIEFQTALDQWKNCMAGYGLEFERPGDAEQMLYRNYVDGTIDMDTLRQREREIAKIDAACYSQHRVAEAFDEAMRRSEAILMEMHSNQVEGLRQSLQAALKRAELHMQ